jgi:hypothetical protein
VQTVIHPAAPCSAAVAERRSADRRFAELAARTGLEPELAQRYASDPVAVLAEFGLSAAEPLYLGGFLGEESGTLIDDLDAAPAAVVAHWCDCYSPAGTSARAVVRSK